MNIKTERLLLKPLSEADKKTMIEIFKDETVARTFMTPIFHSEEDIEMLFEYMRLASLSDKRLVVGLYHNNELIGFMNDVERNETQIELGYVVHPRYQNQGYATEALKALTEELFRNGFTEVITGAFEENTASIRVMEKCGMERLEKTEEIEYLGKLHHCVYYAKETPQKEPLLKESLQKCN